MGYNFFDYKYHIEPHFHDRSEFGMYSTPHLVCVILMYLFVFICPLFFRKADRKKITVFLRVLSIAMVLFEITKITWESYFDITIGDGFNFGGILPLYTCSLFIYALLFAAWSKGRVQRVALAFLCTISLLYGAIGVIVCNGLNWYPLFSFGGMYSFLFHSTMFFTGVFLLITQYYKLEWKDSLLCLIPLFLLALVAIPANYRWGADYMLLHTGGGLPFYEGLATTLAERGLRFLYTVIMFVTHIPLALLVIGVAKLVGQIAKRFSKKQSA